MQSSSNELTSEVEKTHHIKGCKRQVRMKTERNENENENPSEQ